MAYNEILANRIRESLQYLKKIEEKEMMGGLLMEDFQYYKQLNKI